MTVSSFSYKPDWERAQARWNAYWELAPTDRPCMIFIAPRAAAKAVPLPDVPSMEHRWVDPEYLYASAIQRLEGNYLGGETVPAAHHFMVGTVTGCGNHLHFHEGGISLRPSMDSMVPPLNWHPGPDDPWRPRVEAIYRRLLRDATGRFIVPYPLQYPHLDLLNMLRGNEAALTDMVLEPDACKARLCDMRAPWLENKSRRRSM